MEKLKILVVEDNELNAANLKEDLSEFGQVKLHASSPYAIKDIERNKFDIAVIDINLEEEGAGFHVLEAAKKQEGLHTVVLSSHENEGHIEKAYEIGCDDYLSKDISNEALVSFFANLIKRKTSLSLDDFFEDVFVTGSEELRVDIERALKFDTKSKSVFLTGKSGVGKSILAKKIHDNIFGDSKAFVHINCAQFNEGNLESEIFGHVKGAFTGAESDKIGLLEKADGGTLFLDEIGTMPIGLQEKLLIAVETGTFYRSGSEKPLNVKVKKISATCEPIGTYISNGKFRADLFFRLNEASLNIPCLSERRDDIGKQAQCFLKGKRRIVFSKDAKKYMDSYSWPGNSRQLRNVINLLSFSEKGRISKIDLEKAIQSSEGSLNSNKGLPTVSGGFITTEHVQYIKANGMKSFIKKVKQEAGEVFLAKNNNSKRAAMREMDYTSSAFPWKEQPTGRLQ